MRRIASAVLALTAALLMLAEPESARAKWEASTIDGPDLPRRVSLALEDDTAFYGISFGAWPGWDAKPVALDGPPADLGTAYEVESVYWQKAASTLELGEGSVFATYYPAASVASLESASGDVAWIRLDERRAGLLNRYIELGRAGALPNDPTFMDAVVARHDAGERIAVHVGPEHTRLHNANRVDPGMGTHPEERALRGTDAVAFWAAAPDLASGSQPYLTPDAFGLDIEMFGMGGIDPRDVSPGWFDVRFVLPEGRDETYTYFPEVGYLVDLTPVDPGSGTPTLRSWRVPEEMQHLFTGSGPSESRGVESAVIGGGILAWLLGALAITGLVCRRASRSAS